MTTTSTNASVPVQPDAPRGFTLPKFDPMFAEEVPLFLDGPSRDTETDLGEIMSAYSPTQGGFTITVAGIEMPLSVERRFQGLLADVIATVGAAAADFEERGQ